MVEPAVKWVVPGRRKAWEDPTLRVAAPRPAADRRLIAAIVLAVAALGLGLLVMRLSRDEAPVPGLRAGGTAPAFSPDTGVYESENVRIEFRQPPEESKEESP